MALYTSQITPPFLEKSPVALSSVDNPLTKHLHILQPGKHILAHPHTCFEMKLMRPVGAMENKIQATQTLQQCQ